MASADLASPGPRVEKTRGKLEIRLMSYVDSLLRQTKKLESSRIWRE